MKRLEKSKQTFVNREEIIRWGCIQCRISKDLILKALASQSSQSSAKSSNIRKKHLNGRREYEKMKKIYIYWIERWKKRAECTKFIWYDDLQTEDYFK